MRILILILFLTGSSISAQTPIGFKKWHNGGQSYSVVLNSGSPRNYEKPDKSWAKISNNWKFDGDSAYVDESVLKASLDTLTGSSSITLKWGDQDYTITQSLMGIGWLKMSTKGRQWIDKTMDFSNVSADSNIVRWIGISPAVDYQVKKLNGQVQHGLFFKPAFLDSAVVLYDKRADSLDIALANVMMYTLSGNIENHDAALGLLSKRQLKSFGKYTFNLKDQYLKYPGSDTLQRIPVGQFWKKRNDTIFCIEYVMMSQVKRVHELYPDSAVWHNATTKIQGASDVEDTDIRSAFVSNSFGIRDELRVNGQATNLSVIMMRFSNLQSNIGVGATITAAEDSLFHYDGQGTTQDVSLYRLFKTGWVEGTHNNVDCTDGSSWEDWDCDQAEWGTAGGGCLQDDGIDNTDSSGTCTAADSTADVKTTAESTVNVTSTNDVWYGFSISTSFVQAKYDADEPINVFLRTTTGSGDDALFNSVENVSGKDPFLFVTFTLPAGQKVMIRK